MPTPSAPKFRSVGHVHPEDFGKRPSSAPDITSWLRPEIEDLWRETIGDPRIAVAILDGPVDRSHPSLRGAKLTQIEGVVPSAPDSGAACRHGTHVASILFGQHESSVKGIAPQCRGVLIPIFESADDDRFRPCSQLDLARAITLAALQGVRVINISGGEFSWSGRAHPLLENAIGDCARRNILVVAAAGNDACACLHVPAALESVLAVGALDKLGRPLESGNWGKTYQTQGLLAPGERVPGALPGGGLVWGTGSSYAAAVVSGVAALLLSIQIQRGRAPDPSLVRKALLACAAGCTSSSSADCRKFLAGRLQVSSSLTFLTTGRCFMIEPSKADNSVLVPEGRSTDSQSAPAPGRLSETGVSHPSLPTESSRSAEAAQLRSATGAEAESAAPCPCKKAAAPPQLVYSLGLIGYDFPSEARLDALAQKIAAQEGIAHPERGLAYSPERMLKHLEKSPWDAAAIEWTLNLEGTTIYAIRPQGPFAAHAYEELRSFLHDQLEEGVERVSIPGFITGRAMLLNGQLVPILVPELGGMYSWSTGALLDAVLGKEPAGDGHDPKRAGVRNFLDRIYYEARNLGMTPQDRALNYAATNIFEIGQAFASALQDKMELDRIQVVPSPIGRPGSDCWDVEVYFFYPDRPVQTVRKAYRLTVDVSDIIPVTIGEMRCWFTR